MDAFTIVSPTYLAIAFIINSSISSLTRFPEDIIAHSYQLVLQKLIISPLYFRSYKIKFCPNYKTQ